MLVRNLRESKSQVVNIDMMAIRPDKLRMELTTSLGTHLASFAMKDGQMSYIFPKEKKIFHGPATAHSLKAVIGADLDPKLLMNLIFDEVPAGKNWRCVRDQKNYLAQCLNKSEGVKISWTDRDAARKKISMESPSFQIQLSMFGFSTKVEADSSIFELTAPPDFKSHKIGSR